MNFLKQHLYLTLTIFGVILLVLSVYFFSLTFPGNRKQIILQPEPQLASISAFRKSSITGPSLKGDVLCNVLVEQPKCYEGDFPTPTFKWEYCDSNTAKNQKTFRIQVDDQAYENSVFPSPEFDSGDISSSDTQYTINVPALKFNTLYYWGVTIRDNSDNKTGWWGWGDKNFTTSPSCKEMR